MSQAETSSPKYSPYEILRQKRDGHELTEDQWRWFIDGYTRGEIADYQMSALLMAGFIQGLSEKETNALTDAMVYSGAVIDFNRTDVVDKHSTGGVGDKASFILAPLAAACGVKVPMMAGRGLGHTGGTVDKIEAIKGFKVELSLEEFKKRVLEDGLCLIGQTKDIAPADKKIYALRDVTGTVESIPFITASIMSKKLAEGAHGIVMDIKTGNGAFMSKKTQARALAKSLIKTAERFERKMLAMITDMNQPLGDAVGNTLEMIESFETLKGRGPKDITEISVQLAGAMVYLAGKAKTLKAGTKAAQQALDSGAGLAYLRQCIKNQGGDESVIDDYSKMPLAPQKTQILAPKKAYLKSVDTRQIGLHCVALGGGRMKSSDKIDLGVGFVFHCSVGKLLQIGEPMLTVYHHPHQKQLVDQLAAQMLEKDFKFSTTKVAPLPLVYEVLTSKNI